MENFVGFFCYLPFYDFFLFYSVLPCSLVNYQKTSINIRSGFVCVIICKVLAAGKSSHYYDISN